MYDILKHALATYTWQCRGSGTITLAEPPVKDFTDAKIDYSRNKNTTFFYPPNFVIEFTFTMSKIHAKQIYQVLGEKMVISA